MPRKALDIKRIAIFMLAILFFITDRLLKLVAVKAGKEVGLVGEYIKFSFSKNIFIALSLPIPDSIIIRTAIFIIIIGLIFLLFSFAKKNNNLGMAGCLFLICGAASNLADRLAYGWVIDYIEVRYFSVFNLADASVMLGANLLFWALLKRTD